MDKVWFVAAIAATMSACAPRVPVTDLATITPVDLTAAANIRVFTTEQQPPKVAQAISPVTAYSCKHLTTDPPASKGDALQQLQLKAAQMGANAVINVTFDVRGTDTWGTNCWQTVQASGTAARLKE
jgi:uncharacterized protein YbjQ (UPF0145 family)